MQGTATVDKIKLIDGTICDLLTNQTLNIPDLAEVNYHIVYTDFSGSVTLISGDDYRLNMPAT